MVAGSLLERFPAVLGLSLGISWGQLGGHLRDAPGVFEVAEEGLTKPFKTSSATHN